MTAVEVVEADITRLEVDATANAANTDLKHRGGGAAWCCLSGDHDVAPAPPPA